MPLTLLDTDILSEVLKQKKWPSHDGTRRAANHNARRQHFREKPILYDSSAKCQSKVVTRVSVNGSQW